MHRVEQQAGVLARLLAVGQIGATGLADKERVPGEGGPSALGRLRDEGRVAHALRRVPRSVERTEAQLAARELFAVAESNVAAPEQSVAAVDHLGAGDASEFRRAEDEVLLTVCLDHELDAEIVLARDAEVLAHVAAWVDDGSVLAIADDVGHVSQPRRFHALKKHSFSSFLTRGRLSRPWRQAPSPTEDGGKVLSKPQRVPWPYRRASSVPALWLDASSRRYAVCRWPVVLRTEHPHIAREFRDVASAGERVAWRLQ